VTAEILNLILDDRTTKTKKTPTKAMPADRESGSRVCGVAVMFQVAQRRVQEGGEEEGNQKGWEDRLNLPQEIRVTIPPIPSATARFRSRLVQPNGYIARAAIRTVISMEARPAEGR